MTTRRDFLLTVGGVNALMLLPGGVANAGGAERAGPSGFSAAMNDGVERYEVVSLGDVVDGAIQVQMRTAGGELFNVEVLRRSPELPGVANTDALALYLNNQGNGAHVSEEAHCRGAIALARALDASGAEWPELLTLQERARRFPIYGRG